MACNWLMMTSVGDDIWPSGSLACDWLMKTSSAEICVWCILGDPGAVNGGARKINRRDERFHESLQGGVKEPLGTDSHQTISKRLGECWLLIGQKIPLYYSAQSANGSF